MSTERRKHLRIALLAQVEIPHDGSVVLLTAYNLSEGGMFLAAAPHECPWLVAGASVELAIALAEEGGQEPDEDDLLVQARGRVLWRVADQHPPGLGIAFEEMDEANRAQLSVMIDRARRRWK